MINKERELEHAVPGFIKISEILRGWLRLIMNLILMVFNQLFERQNGNPTNLPKWRKIETFWPILKGLVYKNNR